jgi:hypothetical protein
MQKFLNEEHARYSHLFRKPVWSLALFVLISASVSMVVIGILCTTLTSLEQIILLELGLISCCFLTVFLVVPICMRLILNYLFKVRQIGTGLKNLPLSYRSSVQPAPPNSPRPRWALKSSRKTRA